MKEKHIPPLVCVFAHPDDEAFGPGGSIAYFAKQRDVYILCVTSGDAEKRFRKNNITDLAVVRERELVASAKILGVKHVDFLGFKDGGICNNIYHEVARKIQEKVDEYQPDTLLTFEPHGISGHIDHAGVSLITSYVFEHTPYVRNLYYYCELKSLTNMIPEYFIYFPPGYEQKDIGLTIPTKSVWNTKVQAMMAHESQRSDAEMVLGLQSNFSKEEHFLVQTK
jgi:N-acetylglucosamine malate deacetylase 2